MGLETGTYISDLVATNPVGATDPKSQGDDHLRLLKATILATFPNITGAVTPTHTAINQTCVGTGGTFPAINGSALTSLSAANLTGSLPAISGASLTNLTAANITGSHTLPDGVLSTNVPLLNAANTFAAANVISTADATYGLKVAGVTGKLRISGYTSPGVLLEAVNAAEVANIPLTINATTLALAGSTAITLNSVNVTDFARLSQQNLFTASIAGANNQIFENTNAGASAYSQLAIRNNAGRYLRLVYTGSAFSGAFETNGPSGEQAVVCTTSTIPLVLGTSDTARLVIDSSGNFDFKGGTVTTNNASASEVGYKGRPHRDVSSSDNTTAADAGCCIHLTGGSGQTFTLDGDPPVDSEILIVNNSGNNWTIAASGTLTANTTDGSLTMGNKGVWRFWHRSSGNWIGTGFG